MMQLLSPLVLVAVLATAPAHANQSISDGELARFTYAQQFPLGCQEAAYTSNRLRAKPTTDPATLHEAANTFLACAASPYGEGSSALFNRATFAAAAAFLLASRNEAAPQAARDASLARQLAASIVDYRRPNSVRTPALNNDPSPYRTDAGRIVRDATSLLASAGGSTPA
jgi:hypothetical protein